MQIYVACLASYNAGKTHGEWIDASQDADSIQFDIDEMLSHSPVDDAEEWAVHDYDSFPSLGEYPDLSDIEETAVLLSKYPADAVQYALKQEGNDPESAGTWLEDAFVGVVEGSISDTEVDAVMQHYTESGQYDESELPEWAKDHYEALMRDMAQSDINGGEIQVEYQSGGRFLLFTN